MSDKSLSIVVGVDFTEQGDLALAQALKLGSAHEGAEVHAVHVVTKAEAAAADGADDLDRLGDAISELPPKIWNHIDDVSDAIAGGLPQMRVWVHARVGPPAEALEQVAVDYDADLIVVGTHGRRGLSKLVLGSVAETLVRNAHCPVLVARPLDYGGLSKSSRVEPPRPGASLRDSERPESRMRVSERRTLPPSSVVGGRLV